MSEIDEVRTSLQQGKLTRRDVLKLGSALGIGSIVSAALAACGAQTPATQAATSAPEQSTSTEAAANTPVMPPQKKFRAAYAALGVSNSWVAGGVDTMKFLGDLLGIEFTIFDAAFSIDKQRQDVEDIASQDWDFVAIHPGAIESLVDPVKQMISRGILVFDIDTKLTADLNTLDIVTFLEPDNVFMGSAVTQKLVDAIGGKGKVVHTQGALTHTGSQGRAKGFHLVVDKYPDIEVVDETPTDWDPDKSRKIWEDLLVKYPDIVGGMFHNDDLALAAYTAIKAAGKENQIKIVGVDARPPALKAVIDGTLLATVVNPTGRIHGGATWIGWQILTGKAKKEDVPKFIRTDGPAIDKEIAPGILYLAEHLMI